MEFVLHYRGELKSNGGAKDKHRIRKTFHPQLKILWDQPPLKHFRELLDPNEKYTVIRELGGFMFAPLFARHLNFLVELEITLLRPEIPGGILQSGGDIDNRLKTLFDALAMPSQPTAIPQATQPDDDETPFFCVLEDDKLITKVSVQTYCLLEPVGSLSDVECTILVRTKKLIRQRGFGGLDDI